MKTKIITISKQTYTKEIIHQIILRIKRNEILIMPSDTIYGFLTLPPNEEQLRLIKRRETKPFLRLINGYNHLKLLGIQKWHHDQLIKKNWPGPVSFIFNTITESIGVRMPSWQVLHSILSETGPLLSTSVNFSGMPAINKPEEILQTFTGLVNCIIKDNLFIPISASAIVDIRTDPCTIIRKGALQQ